MPKIGEAWINITARTKPLRDALGRARIRIGAFVSSMITKIKRMAQVFAIAFAAMSIWIIKVASAAEESENLFSISMGKMAESTRKWSEQMSTALGLNAVEVRKMVATFNIMLVAMGIGAKKAEEMSQALTQLTFDLASSRDLKPEDAFLKLQSAITGESEPLKRLGILINDTIVKNRGLADGLGSVTKKTKEASQAVFIHGRLVASMSREQIEGARVLSETEKILTRFNLIMELTAIDQGDLERTGGAFANTWRRLGAQITATGETIGSVFLPSVTLAVGTLADFVDKNREKMVGWAEAMRDKIAEWIDKMGGAEGIIDRIKEAFATLVTAFETKVLPALKDIAKVFGTILSSIGALSNIGSMEDRTKPGSFTRGLGNAMHFVGKSFANKVLPIGGSPGFSTPNKQTNDRPSLVLQEAMLRELRQLNMRDKGLL